MKFASMLRRLRNTQGGMRSTGRSAPTPYNPYTDPPPDDPFGVTVAANPQTVSVGTAVNFTGTVSNAPASVTLRYTWDFGHDATDAEGFNGLTPSCSYTMAGRKTVRLTVSYTADSQTIEVFDEVIITVESQLVSVPPGPPVAEAGSNQLAAVNKEVSFDGSDSTSPYGGSLRYLWVFGDERDPTAGSNKMMPSYAYTTPGTKRVTLIVIDEETGLTDSDSVTITVIGVTVTGDPRVVAVGDPDPVEFRSTVSNAPEGADLSYSWDFGDGAIYLRRYGSTASCQYTMPGDQTVTLTVGVTIEGQEVEAEGTCVITVFKVDAGDPQRVAVGDRVQFAGSVFKRA